MKLAWMTIALFLSSSVSAQKTGLVLTQEGQVYYESYGSGEPVLIINGGPGFNCNGFQSLAKEVAKINRAILFDQRGTGRSTLAKTDSTTITMDAMVQDIEDLRQHLGFEQWTVLGHSYGGMLASYYATIHPERINGMILSSSGGVDLELFNDPSLVEYLDPAERDSLAYWQQRMNDGDTTLNTRLKHASLLARAFLYDSTLVPVVAKRLLEVDRNINGLVWADMRRMEFDCKPALREFEKPVLIIQGKNEVVSERLAVIAHETLSNSEMVLIERCGHYGWLEQPEEYLGEVRGFLSDLGE